MNGRLRGLMAVADMMLIPQETVDLEYVMDIGGFEGSNFLCYAVSISE